MTTAALREVIAVDEPVKFTAAYEGPATQGGRIQATLFGPALFHLSTLIERAAQVAYPEKSPLRVQIAANLREGSFEFDLVALGALFASGVPQTALSSLSVGDIDVLLQWLGIKGDGTTGLLGYLKRLGTPVVKEVSATPGGLYNVTFTGNNNTVTIINDVHPSVVRLLRDEETREAASEALAPLRRPGIDGFRIGTVDAREPIRFNKSEAEQILIPEAASREMLTSESQAAVEIVSPNFDADNKWKVRQGDSPFWIRITDPDFNNEVRQGQRAFRSGDYLVGIMRTRYEDTARGLTMEREMIKVVEHKVRERQPSLL